MRRTTKKLIHIFFKAQIEREINLILEGETCLNL